MKYTLLILLTWQSLNIFGQNVLELGQKTDFSHNKNFFGISVNLWSPIIGNNKYPDFNVYKDGKVIEGKDQLDWGSRIDYFRRISRSFSIGLETGFDLFSVHRSSKISGIPSDHNYIFDFENLDVISGTIMPKVQFSLKPGWFPLHIVQQLGVGIRISNKIAKTYHYGLSKNSTPFPGDEPDYDVSYSTIESDYAFRKGENLALTGMYSLSLLSPLNAKLCLHYGVRFTYNFMPAYYKYNENAYESYYSNLSQEAFTFYLNRRMQNAFFQANVGLTYGF